jgi:asparagine synthase (glutamine-hydrolysing)
MRTRTRSTTGNVVSIALPGAGPIVRVAANDVTGLLDIELIGEWSGEEFGSYKARGAVLLLFGHCLLGAAEIAAEFDAAAESDHWDRTADWPGAYAAVIAHRGTVTAYTDLAGQFPLYYSQQGVELLISPDPAGLAAAYRRPPDALSAAAHIACPSVLPLWWGRSAYTGVGRLEGGMALRARHGRLEVEPTRCPRPVPGTSLVEGAARLRAALTEGVRIRCADQQVSADLSGGLDSSSIAFLAADTSAAPVASVVYHQPLAPAADLADATRLANLTSSIDLAVVHGSARTLPFAGLLGPAPGAAITEADAGWPRTAEPTPRALTAQRDAARLAVAAESGARVHLTGEGGDAVLMTSPAYLADLARQHALRTLWRHCGEYARLRHVAPASLATSAIRLAGTGPGAALRAVATQLAASAAPRSGWADLVSWWQPSEAASWLTRDLRRQLADLAGDPHTARAVPHGVGPADLAALSDLRRSGDAQRQLRAVGRSYGVAVHAPFLDTAAVRAALEVPAVTRADPWSYKPILASALAGLVPADVFARRTKGDYSTEEYRGARQAITELRALLRGSRLADLGVIEPAPVLAALDRMAAGIAVPLGPLNMLLATEIWLRAAAGAEDGDSAPC